MADGQHQAAPEKNLFCCITPTRCNCGNSYRTVCAPGWASFTFPRINKLGVTKDYPYEAHHVLCVQSINQELFRNEEIGGSVRATKWCINQKGNMLALPLWGHTVKWYCKITSSGGAIDLNAAAPPFANLPQHDWDHNSGKGYRYEIDKELKKLAGRLKNQGHEFIVSSLAGELNGLSITWTGKLRGRGARNGGTHTAWLQAPTDPTNSWCHAFSMSSTGNVSSKSYPVRNFNAKVSEWIQKIAKAIRGG